VGCMPLARNLRKHAGCPQSLRGSDAPAEREHASPCLSALTGGVVAGLVQVPTVSLGIARQAIEESDRDIAVQACSMTLEHRAAVRIASLTAAANSVAVVDLMHRLAGSSAIFQSSPLEQCFRDIHTAAHQLQVQEGRWETTGSRAVGLEPRSPLL
jgi:hypothetical protein